MIMVLLLIAILMMQTMVQSATYCDDAFQCFNRSMTRNCSTTCNIWCGGTGSCSLARITNIALNDSLVGDLNCDGFRSCQSLIAFISNTSDSESAQASGYLSLAWSKRIDITASNINVTNNNDLQIFECGAEASCYGISNMTFHNNNNWLRCLGAKSCANIDSIVSPKVVTVYGTFALANSTIYSGGTGTTVTVIFAGYYSGFNSTIICQSSDTCVVGCWSNGCRNVVFYCQNMASCSYNGWSCDYDNGNNNNYNCLSFIDVDNPSNNIINYDYSSDFDKSSSIISLIPGLQDIFETNYDESLLNEMYTSNYVSLFDQFSNEENKFVENILCDDKYDCDYTTIWNTSNYTNLWCLGEFSCTGSKFVNIDLNIVECDATTSCRYVEISSNDTIEDMNSTGSSLSPKLRCRARGSCDQSVINKFSSIISTGLFGVLRSDISNGDYIGCFGELSCLESNIVGVSTIVATGTSSITYSNVSSGNISNMTIYLMGNRAAESSTFVCQYNSTCTVYCGARYACDNANMSIDNTTRGGGWTRINLYDMTADEIIATISATATATTTTTSTMTPITTTTSSTTSTTTSISTTIRTSIRTSISTTITTSTRAISSTSLHKQINETRISTTIRNITVTMETEEANRYRNFAQFLDRTGQLFALGTFAVGVIISLWNYILANKYHKKKSDSVNYISIFRFFHNLGDLWTDIFFSLILYLQYVESKTILLQILFTVSGILLITTHILSILVAIFWNFKWNGWMQDHPSRIHSYLQKYRFVVFIFVVFCNFYATVDLIRSKAFYSEMFYFPLRKQEANKLDKFRFVNVILFENIPQFTIQIIYLLYVSDNNINDTFSIVFISIIFSAFSILFSFVKYFSQCIEKQRKLAKFGNTAFTHVTKIQCKFSLQCDKFESIHSFCYNRCEYCITSLLVDHGALSNVYDRSDVLQSVEVYYINNNSLETLKKLIVYFEIEIETINENSTVIGLIYSTLLKIFNPNDETTPSVIDIPLVANNRNINNNSNNSLLPESFVRAMRIDAKSKYNYNSKNAKRQQQQPQKQQKEQSLMQITDFKVLQYTTQLIDGDDKLNNNKIQMISINQASQVSNSISKSQSRSQSKSKSKAKNIDRNFQYPQYPQTKMVNNLSNNRLRHYNTRNNHNSNDNNKNNDNDANVDHDQRKVKFEPQLIEQFSEIFSYRSSDNNMVFVTNTAQDYDYSSDSDDGVNQTGATTDTGNESQL